MFGAVLAKKSLCFIKNRGFYFGAGEMNRTPDLLITNELLYRLSYTGLCICLRVKRVPKL